jgi:hypothetical protein
MLALRSVKLRAVDTMALMHADKKRIHQPRSEILIEEARVHIGFARKEGLQAITGGKTLHLTQSRNAVAKSTEHSSRTVERQESREASSPLATRRSCNQHRTAATGETFGSSVV